MRIFNLNIKSIKYKLLLSIGLIFMISFVLFIVYLILDQSGKKNNDLLVKMENDSKLISMTNIVNVWNLDKLGIEQNLSTFLNMEEIISAEIKDAQDITILKKEKPKIGSLKTKKLDIIRENSKIGSVEIMFTDYYIKKEINKIMLQLIISGFFVLAVISFFLYYITNNIITKPINKTAGFANSIADGDLDFIVPESFLSRQDEIGFLALEFKKMIDTLNYKLGIIKLIAEDSGDFTINVKLASEKDAFGRYIQEMLVTLNYYLLQIKKASMQVSISSNQVAQASQSLSQGATEQASSLEEITSSITEINYKSKQNTEYALQASVLSKEAMDNSELGNKQMKDLVNSMSNITKSAEGIKKIVKVIDDIAFQTNLLALNANVEAARAGKYGKGFAVVAEEVRNLAGRSAVSVRETTAMVEEAVKNILDGNNLVEVTSKQLDEITLTANKVANLVGDIAASSKEQTQKLDQISQSIHQIDKVTQSNAASAEESASAAEELSGQSDELKGIVEKFKLIEDLKHKNNQHELNLLTTAAKENRLM
jgi:methyl-accepting chemotaxis protein